MSEISHHIPEPMLMAYAAGTLDHAFSLIVAAHVSLCDECRANLGAHEAVGGTLLQHQAVAKVPEGLKASVLARLDDAVPSAPVYDRTGVFPAPVMAALDGEPPRWRSVGMGVRQCVVHAGRDGTARLLYIPPGRAVPDHGHNGTELTLVLQGAFSDETGRYRAGDVEVADEHLEHTPTADPGAPCICLAATDAKLRFRGLIPRILQPIFRI